MLANIQTSKPNGKSNSPMSRHKIVVALSGQPNCGKSTMFNSLTGSSARVGNYPGITVERMEGYHNTDDYRIKFIDLPGTYSLTSYSMEEIVARNYILDEQPDCVVCMLDSVALERSLYLVVQLLEIGAPVIIGLNMMDDVKKKGIHIDSKQLSKLLNVPVVECVARRGIGKKEIIEEIVKLHDNKKLSKDIDKYRFDISYGHDLDPAIDEMIEVIETNNFLTDKFPSRWLAVKYMEEDDNIQQKGLYKKDVHDQLIEIVKNTESHTEKTLATYPEAIIADYRYGFISSLLKQNVIHRAQLLKSDYSDKIDKLLTQRLFGPLIMIGVLYILFYLTFQIGAYPQSWMQMGFDLLGQLGDNYISNELLRSLIVSGIIDGVGSVLSFAPLILIMFALLCFLEDLGYMARVAYMLDKVFRTFGLHGASVMPFIISGGIPGGCAVPGVMTARTLRSPKERLATILTAPFMVCGAKTTVFLMLAQTFFPGKATFVMLSLTLTSWFFALIISKILRSTLIKGAPTPFIMELPPYRFPTLYGIVTHTWDRVWQFVKKAGTVIFVISILMWALITFPRLSDHQKEAFNSQRQSVIQTFEIHKTKLSKHNLKTALSKIDDIEQRTALKNSVGGKIGVWLECISKYCGFPWQANIALIGGFAAKEVILSTLSTAYSLGNFNPDESPPETTTPQNITGATSKVQSKPVHSLLSLPETSLELRLAADPQWTIPAVISILLFILLYAPCFVTVVAMAKETSWPWALFGTFGSLIFTYFLCVAVYQSIYLFY